jgi:hypothetical protein
LFQVGFRIGHHVLNYLWRPSERVRLAIAQKYGHFFDKSKYIVIGLHMRYEFLDRNGKLDTHNFIECAKEVERQYAQQTLAEGSSKKEIKWFLATDSPQHSEQIKAMHGDRWFTSDGLIGHIITSDNSRHEPGMYERTVVDNELLSKCDELIVTAGTTYGMIAAIRAGRMPLFFNGMRNEKKCHRLSLGHHLPLTPMYRTAVI